MTWQFRLRRHSDLSGFLFAKDELYRLDSMAGDGHHRGRGLDDCVAKEVQAELGVLVIPL